jgi:hypothetical protein
MLTRLTSAGCGSAYTNIVEKIEKKKKYEKTQTRRVLVSFTLSLDRMYTKGASP